MDYQVESVVACKEEVQELLEQHWEEIALNKDVIKLNPDWDQYKAMERAHMLKAFGARDNGKLVGYFVVTITRSMHYKDHLFANNDVIYLHPDYRKGLAGAKLVKFAEKKLKEMGVSVLMVNTKLHRPFSRLLEFLKFKPVETVYSKRLV